MSKKRKKIQGAGDACLEFYPLTDEIGNTFTGKYLHTQELGESEDKIIAHVFEQDETGDQYYLGDNYQINAALNSVVGGKQVKERNDIWIIFTFKGKGEKADGQPFNKIAFEFEQESE